MKPTSSRAFLFTVPVLLASGAAVGQTLIETIFGDAADQQLSVAMVCGDVDADDVDDLVVASPHDAGNGTDAGLVRVIDGDTGAVLDEAEGDAGDLFGTALAVLDYDGDGVPDIAVGAPGDDYVVVLSGDDLSEVLATLTGPSGSRFGAALAGGTDLDEDGDEDLVVGAPDNDVGGADTGSAFAYSEDSSSPFASLHGDHAGGHYGTSAAMVPVWQAGGGEPIVVVGWTDSGTSGAGGIHLFEFEGGTPSLSFTAAGGSPGDRFGTLARFVGDLDDDDVSDLLAGADPASAAGYVRVLSGDDGAVLFTRTAPVAGTGYGAAGAGPGDVDGDGVPDFAVGAPLDDTNGADAGALWVYSGDDGSLLHALVGTSAGDRLGTHLARLGDRDGDDLDDLLACAPHDDAASATDAGAVALLSFTPWDDEGNGVPGLYGVPDLSARGGLIPEGEITLELASAREIEDVVLYVGSSLVLDTSTGLLAPLGEIVDGSLVTDADGELELLFELPGSLASGDRLYMQMFVDDAAASGGVARSNVLAGVVP